ncbi:Octicosapeptide/Phox/Bem1p family protein [Euphorbia peplus]|nr:Octicosapeptide/Phox/Bem1p family protein [Euphorbia peplus]
MDLPAATSSATTNKLRLMCSYGGQITSRPQTKSLYYAGGDTRLISIPSDTSTLTLSSLINHLSSTLHLCNYPFTLKYQLPNHDLDSLISVSSDEDLLIMLDEHHRLSPTASRIRLFLFPAKRCEVSGNQLRHPKTESWFADVLKSAELMQKGGVGYGGDGGSEGNNGSCGAAESMVLETSSSLGSSSSSAVSFLNLPAKGLSEDLSRDNTVATAVWHPQTGTYQDPVSSFPLENIISMAPLESENKIFDPQIGVEMHRTVQVPGIPVSYQYDQPQQVVYVHTAPQHYVPQNQTVRPMQPSYYPMASPMPQQQMYYQTNQPPPPVYYVPVRHPHPYNTPAQSSLVTPATISSSRPPTHPNPSSAQVAYRVATDSPPVPEITSQVYRTNQGATSHVNLPHNPNLRHAGMNLQAQSIGMTELESTNYTNEVDDDDVVHAQIYKSQPPAPALLSQYQTMTKATLSEALAQLNMENTKQQLRASQPQ